MSTVPSKPVAGEPGSGASGAHRVSLTGAVESVTYQPVDAPPHYEAVLDDGHGQRARLVWHGQRYVPGVDAGVWLHVEGTMSEQDHRPTIYDPHHEIVAAQE